MYRSSVCFAIASWSSHTQKLGTFHVIKCVFILQKLCFAGMYKLVYNLYISEGDYRQAIESVVKHEETKSSITFQLLYIEPH